MNYQKNNEIQVSSKILCNKLPSRGNNGKSAEKVQSWNKDQIQPSQSDII
jgi:choline kinase